MIPLPTIEETKIMTNVEIMAKEMSREVDYDYEQEKEAVDIELYNIMLDHVSDKTSFLFWFVKTYVLAKFKWAYQKNEDEFTKLKERVKKIEKGN